MTSDQGEPSPSPEDIFADYIVCHTAGEPADFEEVCASHPDVADELRELQTNWMNLHAVLGKLGVSASLAQSLSAHYGDEVDPRVSLESEYQCADLVPGALDRLSTRIGAFGRYSIKGEVAAGGQGVVLRVWDDDIRRHLAMKVMLGQGEIGASGATPPVDSRSLGRFLEEAQVTGQLDHPGIVPVHELGLDAEGRVYFTMKLVNGLELNDVFELAQDGEQGWTRMRVLGVILKVCQAMSYAHAKGVVHRDLKPRNVMVGRFGEVYVMDWGLAHVLGREDEKDLRVQPPPMAGEASERSAKLSTDSPLLTIDGEVVGTPAYMSPEQALGNQKQMGPHSDVYSIGAMLYHLVAGHMPYVEPGEKLDNYDVWYRVQMGPPAALEQRATDVPAELVAICEKAMARDVERRYRDTAELAEDLSAYLENRVVSAYETGAWAELRKWVRRNRALAGTALAAGVVMLVSLVVISALLADNLREIAAVQRLSALQDHEDLIEQVTSLWPPHPEHIDAYREWIADAEKLVADLPLHLAKREELRRLAQPGTSPSGEPEWGFPPDEGQARWWHTNLSQLVAALEALQDPATGLLSITEDAVSPQHGWSVHRRLALAERLQGGFAAGGEFHAAWNEAIAAIQAHATYGGLVLRPQTGLVPIGPDPDSGLWEFWHVASGSEPERDEEGGLELSEEMGVVLILIPEGPFWMGSSPDLDSPHNYNKHFRADQAPVHEVQLSAYFVSKFELTQGQWLRFTGVNPSYYSPEADESFSLLHPVEGVNWTDFEHQLLRMHLALPSEAQWEKACRGGRETEWWTGNERDALADRRVVNLADQTAVRSGAPWKAPRDWPELDDGHALHAPVGTYAANPFGLHEVHGNVWEWCQDAFMLEGYSQHEGRDPVVPWDGVTGRVIRGGAFDTVALQSGSGYRYQNRPMNANPSCGARPARAVER
ncbi:MAG: SUMF1/EgtB/PvdO family nonheme iron enzyme [bacterium]|nr:SUMF1/EgtB/PvdO family nonheme iron enzyme [bacterium]